MRDRTKLQIDNATADFEYICEERGIRKDDIISPRRSATLTKLRWEIAQELRALGYSVTTIAAAIHKNHTSVYYMLNPEWANTRRTLMLKNARSK